MTSRRRVVYARSLNDLDDFSRSAQKLHSWHGETYDPKYLGPQRSTRVIIYERPSRRAPAMVPRDYYYNRALTMAPREPVPSIWEDVMMGGRGDPSYERYQRAMALNRLQQGGRMGTLAGSRVISWIPYR